MPLLRTLDRAKHGVSISRDLCLSFLVESRFAILLDYVFSDSSLKSRNGWSEILKLRSDSIDTSFNSPIKVFEPRVDASNFF